MKPRAFVIMPFGDSVTVGDDDPKDPKEIVDFQKVYTKLIEPALTLAGCEPFRADDELSAGDIRTDMFFELATADFVVAEISALNPNVFYELGVRNGICPRGVFLIRGDWKWSRPFDIAPDRNFTYKGASFEKGNDASIPQTEIDHLASVLRHTIKADPQKVGSPVYALLPGLKAADIGGIQTSKARYFTVCQEDWTERVRRAQRNGLPGNILALAEDAPTPFHRAGILVEAAKALVGLCRYDAAQQILQQVLDINPDHAEARMHLGLVLQQRGEIMQAEDEMRSFLAKHADDPSASDRLGHVYRQLWYLSWKEPDTANEREGQSARRKKAKESQSLASLAYRSFMHAYEIYPESYFNGFNAALMLAIHNHLFKNSNDAGDSAAERLDFGLMGPHDLIGPVRVQAAAARRRAVANGDHEQLFWSTTTLSGLALLDETETPSAGQTEALRLIQDACALPQATLFQMEMLKERLTLLRDVHFHSSFAKDAIEIVEEAKRKRAQGRGWPKIVLFYAYGTHPEDRPWQFPIAEIPSVEQKIKQTLEGWQIGPGDLTITSGIQEGDLLFADLCRQRGADVHIFLLDPAPGALSGGLWASQADNWAERFQQLANDKRVSILSHIEEIGQPPINPSQAKCRHNRWVMNTARLAAEGQKGTEFYGIVMADGGDVVTPTGSDDAAYPEQPAFFIAEIRRALHYRGTVKVIRRENAVSASVAAAS